MSWLAGCAFAASFFVTGGLRALALRLQLLDVPNERSSHAIPTATGGGIAITIVTLSALGILWALGLIGTRAAIGIGGGGAVVAAVGLLDDCVNVSAGIRFAVHLVAAVWFVVWCSDLLQHLGPYLSGALPVVWNALMVVALVWAINLFNFMDGIDGLAGSEGLFVAAFGSWFLLNAHGGAGISLLLAVVAAASAGFLFWNISPARIFLGDAGSGFLGFMLGAAPLVGSAESHIPLATWVILWGTFLVDATVTLLRRVTRGERWYQAHRSHAYQRLSRIWSSHLRVTAAYLAIDLLWLAPMAIWSVVAPNLAVWLAAIALCPLVIAAWVLGAGHPDVS